MNCQEVNHKNAKASMLEFYNKIKKKYVYYIVEIWYDNINK